MDDFATVLIIALGLAIAIEGMVYALFPDGMKRMMASVIGIPSGNIRVAGVAAAALGVFVVWMMRG